MKELVLVVHVLGAVGLVALVLLEQGKGADIGAAFGSGASGSLFGARGAANFLTRVTAVLATMFFATSLTLAILAVRNPRSRFQHQLCRKRKLQRYLKKLLHRMCPKCLANRHTAYAGLS